MASGSIRARSMARNIIDPTMARTKISEEVMRIAWRVSMSGVERASHDFGYAVPTPATGYGINVAAAKRPLPPAVKRAVTLRCPQTSAAARPAE
jgi:hypothetical protein